jgi:hypothetical protein
MATEADSSEILVRARCTKQSALNAVRNAKFLSSLQETGLFTAKNATEKRDRDSDSLALKQDRLVFYFLFRFFLAKVLYIPQHAV